MHLTLMGDTAMRGAGSRVLYTGRGEAMVDVLMELLQDQYVQSKCQPNAQAFGAELERVQPQAIVICLEEENPATLQAFRILERDIRFLDTPVVAISEETADCDLLQQTVQLRKLKILAQPTDVEEILTEIEEAVAPKPVAALIESTPEETVDETEEERENRGTPETTFSQAGQASAGAAKAVSGAKSATTAPVSDKPIILVVDDDIMMLNTIKLFLQDLYDVTVVPTGKLALKFLSKRKADLVLLDYMMPEMDGPAVLQQIRENELNGETPVLFLTGVSERDLVMRGLSQLPEGYLLKPVNRDSLLERVMEILLGL